MVTTQDQQQLMKCAHEACNCLLPQGDQRFCSPRCAEGKTPCQCGHRECTETPTA